MIEHHGEAITMAETEVRDGRSNHRAQAAREKIITERAEIGQMETRWRSGDRVCDGQTRSGAS
jgi:uncharacterized protein (DUF305 family)